MVAKNKTEINNAYEKKDEVGWENKCVNISEKSIENDRPLNVHKVYRMVIQ